MGQENKMVVDDDEVINLNTMEPAHKPEVITIEDGQEDDGEIEILGRDDPYIYDAEDVVAIDPPSLDLINKILDQDKSEENPKPVEIPQNPRRKSVYKRRPINLPTIDPEVVELQKKIAKEIRIFLTMRLRRLTDGDRNIEPVKSLVRRLTGGDRNIKPIKSLIKSLKHPKKVSDFVKALAKMNVTEEEAVISRCLPNAVYPHGSKKTELKEVIICALIGWDSKFEKREIEKKTLIEYVDEEGNIKHPSFEIQFANGKGLMPFHIVQQIMEFAGYNYDTLQGFGSAHIDLLLWMLKDWDPLVVTSKNIYNIPILAWNSKKSIIVNKCWELTMAHRSYLLKMMKHKTSVTFSRYTKPEVSSYRVECVIEMFFNQYGYEWELKLESFESNTSCHSLAASKRGMEQLAKLQQERSEKKKKKKKSNDVVELIPLVAFPNLKRYAGKFTGWEGDLTSILDSPKFESLSLSEVRNTEFRFGKLPNGKAFQTWTEKLVELNLRTKLENVDYYTTGLWDPILFPKLAKLSVNVWMVGKNHDRIVLFCSFVNGMATLKYLKMTAKTRAETMYSGRNFYRNLNSTSLEVISFKLEEETVKHMDFSYLFLDCSALKRVDVLSYPSVAKVDNMTYVGSKFLEVLNLRNKTRYVVKRSDYTSYAADARNLHVPMTLYSMQLHKERLQTEEVNVPGNGNPHSPKRIKT